VPSTRRLPLRGADLVLMAIQALWRRGDVSNNALLVIECDGAIPVARVGQALDRLLDDCPWPAARLRRTFPWGALHWVAGARAGFAPPRIDHRVVASPAEEHGALEAQLGAAIDPRDQAPLRLAVVDRDPPSGAGGHGLVLTWFHPLMDPRGAQNLLGHLALLDRQNGGPPAAAPAPFAPPPDSRPYRERGRLARQSRRHIRALAPTAPVSPGTGLTAPGAPRFRRLTLDGPAHGDICARLAAVARAIADLSDRRGLPDAPFLVPIAVDLRPKGEPGPIFGNMLGFHFAQFARAETADVAGLARSLRRQMADAVRAGRIEAATAALEFIKYRRLRAMLRELPGTARGETFSFNCADVGEFPARIDPFFGRHVVNAYHVPAVMPRPGIGVFFNRCGGADNMIISWIEGAVSEDDVARVEAIVREGLARSVDDAGRSGPPGARVIGAP
jgi:hypothetical protein